MSEETNAEFSKKVVDALVESCKRSGIDVSFFSEATKSFHPELKRVPRGTPALVSLTEKGYKILIDARAKEHPEALKVLLEHELAHVRRGDLLRNLERYNKYEELRKKGIHAENPLKFSNIANDYLINDREMIDVIEKTLGVRGLCYEDLLDDLKESATRGLSAPFDLPEDRALTNGSNIEMLLTILAQKRKEQQAQAGRSQSAPSDLMGGKEENAERDDRAQSGSPSQAGDDSSSGHNEEASSNQPGTTQPDEAQNEASPSDTSDSHSDTPKRGGLENLLDQVNAEEHGRASLEDLLDNPEDKTLDGHDIDTSADPEKAKESHIKTVLKLKKSIQDQLESLKEELEKKTKEEQNSERAEELNDLIKEIESMQEKINNEDALNNTGIPGRGAEKVKKGKPPKSLEELEELIKSLESPAVHPLIKRMLDELGSGPRNLDDRSYSRPRRGMPVKDFYLKGHISRPTKQIVMIFDVSGSMSEHFPLMYQLASILSEEKNSNLHFIFHDDEVIYSGPTLPEENPFTHGGTRFAPAWEEISNAGIEPDVIIAATDGYLFDDKEFSRILEDYAGTEIYWLLTDPHGLPDSYPGERIDIKTGEPIETVKRAPSFPL